MGARQAEESGTATAQRRAAREERIAAGAAELEQRFTDLLGSGLAASAGEPAVWEEAAARMVDAQAPGIAARLRELASLPGTHGEWPERFLAECALLHLLLRAAHTLHAAPGALPAPLAATVRTRLGFTVRSASLRAEGTDRTRDEWLVLAQRDTAEGELTARRIWLRGLHSGRTALLLSYAAGESAPEPELPGGSLLAAELVFHPAAAPLRAVVGEDFAPARPAPGVVPAGVPIDEALGAYGAALAQDPWLERWPVVVAPVVPIPPANGEGWQLADGAQALPVSSAAVGHRLWRLAAVSGGAPVTVFGELGPSGLEPVAVFTADTGVEL